MALQDKYINPFTDYGFKKLFGTEMNKDLLIDFLNQVLPERHHVQDLSYTPTEQLGASETDRKAIFDLYCTSHSRERFIVEIQKAKLLQGPERVLFNFSYSGTGPDCLRGRGTSACRCGLASDRIVIAPR